MAQPLERGVVSQADRSSGSVNVLVALGGWLIGHGATPYPSTCHWTDRESKGPFVAGSRWDGGRGDEVEQGRRGGGWRRGARVRRAATARGVVETM